MDDQHHEQGRTNYDWISGMRVGILVGGLLGLVLGWAFDAFPFIWLIVGGAAGGFLGAQLARRW
ncbi:MAG: hypothetical protein QNJ77_14575 [Acidimicrobiia bacterium]|nr:hypothetical protein [Acidimicrobiia bacterium]